MRFASGLAHGQTRWHFFMIGLQGPTSPQGLLSY